MRTEASGAAPIDQPPAAPEPVDGPSPRIRKAALMAVFGVGNAICLRCRVTPIKPEEAASIGDAVAELAHLYGFSLDPKTEGWLALGGALSEVAVPRVLEYKPPPPERVADELTPETRGAGQPPPPAPVDPPKDDQAARDAASFTSAAP